MDPVETTLIERSCERLCHDYAWLIDMGRGPDAADLFSADAFLSLRVGAVRGQSEIRSFFGKLQAAPVLRRHVVTNVRIDVHDDAHASGTSYLTLYRMDWAGSGAAPIGLPFSVEHYEDVFVRTEDGWRFDRREATAALQT